MYFLVPSGLIFVGGGSGWRAGVLNIFNTDQSSKQIAQCVLTFLASDRSDRSLDSQFAEQNTPGTRVGPGFRDQTLAVKTRKVA